MSEPTYDARTCITAGELREMGVPVSKEVPDCAWVPLRAIRHIPNSVKVEDKGGGKMACEWKIEVSEPFRWVEASFLVGKGPLGGGTR